MKVLTVFLSAVLFILCCTGCNTMIKGRTEIDEILFVTVFGIDKISEGEDTVSITINAPSAQPPGEPGGGKKKEAHIFTSQGKSVFEALRKLRLFANRKMFLGHVGFIIIGEEAAKNDVQKQLDLLARDHELRLNAQVLVAKGHTAKDVIKKTANNDEFLATYLKNLQDNASELSQSGKMELIRIMQAFDRKNTAPYIPYITLNNNTSYPGLGSKNENIFLEGYAILKGTSLQDYITDGKARGFNWIKNKIESGAIVVKTKQGNNITLEIIRSKARITPIIHNGNINIYIKLQMCSNVAEVQGTENIFKEDILLYLESKQNKIIKSEMQSVIDYAQKSNTDFLNIASAVRHRYPVKWESIKNKWEEVFPKLPVDIEVESKISRTYNIGEPGKSNGGK